MEKTFLKVGARGSKLALAQAEEVVRLLQKNFMHLEFEIIPIKTSGDLHQNVSLAQIGGKGLFLKEIETALLEKKIDIAVHSAKDVPSEEVDGLAIPCALERSSPYDAFISLKYKNVHDLPDGAVVATCSVRRKLQLLMINNSLNVVPLRGNLGTRLNRLNEFDGIVLAEAGLRRIGLEGAISQVLDEHLMLSAVGQGIICVQCCRDDKYLFDMLQTINHERSFIELTAERNFMKAVNGSCSVPLAAFAKVDDVKKTIAFRCMLSGSKDTIFLKKELDCSMLAIEECWDMGIELKSKVGELASDI